MQLCGRTCNSSLRERCALSRGRRHLATEKGVKVRWHKHWRWINKWMKAKWGIWGCFKESACTCSVSWEFTIPLMWESLHFLLFVQKNWSDNVLGMKSERQNTIDTWFTHILRHDSSSLYTKFLGDSTGCFSSTVSRILKVSEDREPSLCLKLEKALEMSLVTRLVVYTCTE